MIRCTLIFVTHSVEEGLLLGSRVIVLSPHPGRIIGEVVLTMASTAPRPRTSPSTPRRDASRSCSAGRGTRA